MFKVKLLIALSLYSWFSLFSMDQDWGKRNQDEEKIPILTIPARRDDPTANIIPSTPRDLAEILTPRSAQEVETAKNNKDSLCTFACYYLLCFPLCYECCMNIHNFNKSNDLP